MNTFFDDLAKQLNRVEPLHIAGEYAVSMIQKKIHQGKFKPNSSLTAKIKQGKNSLSDRGSLKASINYKLKNKTVVVGTNHPGAVINNYGGEIKAKKDWLFIPASKHTRTLFRRYGWSVKEVCTGLRKDGFSVWRQGRALFYRQKGKDSSKKEARMIFILKRSVRIPKREFMKLTSEESDVIFDILTGGKKK